MKKLLLSLLFLIIFSKLNAQTCQWAQKIAGNNDDEAWSIAVDGSSNVYVAGDFMSSTLSFNNGISLTNSGNDDAYIARYIGINDVREPINKESIFNIRPNPANNYISISGSENIIGKDIEIYSILGVKLISNKIDNQEIQINIENLTNGINFIKVGNETKMFVKE